jgi:hypothetical protein
MSKPKVVKAEAMTQDRESLVRLEERQADVLGRWIKLGIPAVVITVVLAPFWFSRLVFLGCFAVFLAQYGWIEIRKGLIAARLASLRSAADREEARDDDPQRDGPTSV